MKQLLWGDLIRYRPTEQVVWAPQGGGLQEACLVPPDLPSSWDAEALALAM